MQIKKQHKVKRPFHGNQMVDWRADRLPSGYARDSSSGSRGTKRVPQGFCDDAYGKEQPSYSRSGKTRYFENQERSHFGNAQAQGGLAGYRRMQNGRPTQSAHFGQQNSKRHMERVQQPVMTQASDLCSELYDINARSDAFHYDPYFLQHSDYPTTSGFVTGRLGPGQAEMPRYPQRFTEKHLIESLNVNAVLPSKPVMFYNMLNQGNKRGKETQVLALDCERVLTDKGEMLARVSVVNFYGNIVFDTLVKPCRYHSEQPNVIDYREWITGIKPIDLEHAPTFGNIEPIIKKVVKDKTIVGHSLTDDFKTLNIDTKESNCSVRDISNIDIFMQKIDRDSHSPIKDGEDLSTSLNGSGGLIGSKNSSHSLKSEPCQGSNKMATPRKKVIANFIIKKRKLKDLAEEFLNAKIQAGHHSSVIDARAALALYRMNYEVIETQFRCREALKELQLQKDKMELIEHQKEAEHGEQQSSSTGKDSSGKKAANGTKSTEVEQKEGKVTEEITGALSEEKELLRRISAVQISSQHGRLDAEQSVFDAQNSQSLKDIQYLMKNNAEIFNVTPPNAKDEDKIKNSGKYKLLQKNQANLEWQGFTPSKIEHIDKNQLSNSHKGSTLSSLRYSNDRRVHERLGFDPFSHDWSNSSRKQGGPSGSAKQMSQKEEWMPTSSPSQPLLSYEQPSGFNSMQKRGKNGSTANKGQHHLPGHSAKSNIKISKFQLD